MWQVHKKGQFFCINVKQKLRRKKIIFYPLMFNTKKSYLKPNFIFLIMRTIIESAFKPANRI